MDAIASKFNVSLTNLTKPSVATGYDAFMTQLQDLMVQVRFQWIIEFTEQISDYTVDQQNEIKFVRFLSLCQMKRYDQIQLEEPTTDKLRNLHAVLPQFQNDYKTSLERLQLLPTTDLTSMQKISCLVSMNEYSWANQMITELSVSKSVAVLEFCARQLLVMGNLQQASHLIQSIETDNHDQLMLNRSMVALCQGDFASAQTILATLMSASPQNKVAINNLCICMLHHGNKLQEAISLLSQFVSEGLSECSLFNLTTMLELATEMNDPLRQKIIKSAHENNGDALDVSLLKL